MNIERLETIAEFYGKCLWLLEQDYVEACRKNKLARDQLLKWANAQTKTNCAWYVYAAAQFILQKLKELEK